MAHHKETHRSHRIGWLRAAVLGANDGIISTASLILGVTASRASHETILMAGSAGLIAGAMSMASGEYVSVSSQADTEQADIERERYELATDEPRERAELASIYVSRGLDRELARQVANQLMAHDALEAHARDELGISERLTARPVQAALTSAAMFSMGAALPLLTAYLAPVTTVGGWVAGASILSLAALGVLASRTGGASAWRGGVRVVFWGMLAMAFTAGVGTLFHTGLG